MASAWALAKSFFATSNEEDGSCLAIVGAMPAERIMKTTASGLIAGMHEAAQRGKAIIEL